MRGLLALFIALAAAGPADDNRPLGERARQYLIDLVRLDSSNPPGNETRVADYLKQVADSHGISCEELGNDPRRLNFVARLKGTGKGRPLLLMAHSDVAPVNRAEWSVDPFGAEIRNGFIYGRGTQNDKSLLAAEIAVMVEVKRRNIKLGRDLILMSEADEEGASTSTGIEWMTQHAWPKIDSEFALNEGGSILETKEGTKVFEIQTTQKVRMRVVLTAKGTAGDGSTPKADNALVHLSRALVKLSEAEEPVRMIPATRRYLRELSKVADYSWLEPLRRKLDDPATAQAAANQIRARDPELGAMLSTSVAPTMLRAGVRTNVIPNTAEAEVDVLRVPSETRDDVLARFRQTINDSAVDVALAPGPQAPTAEPSLLTTALYRAMERTIARIYPRDVITPYMSLDTTDSNFLRAKGVAVYGVPIFVKDGAMHGAEERIASQSLEDGVELLWQMVLETAGGS